MAVARRAVDESERDEGAAEFMQLFGAICAVPTVRRIGVQVQHGNIDLWVLLAVDDEAQEERIYRALQTYRAAPAQTSVDLHVIWPDEEDDAFPHDARIVYERP